MIMSGKSETGPKSRLPFTHSIFLFFLLLITPYSFLISKAIAQTQFQLSIDAGSGEQVWSIVQTTDGGYVAAGTTGFNAYIIKLNASLSLQWTRIMSSGPFGDVILSIVQTTDGGYVAAGSNIFKLDANGTLQWSENISGEANSIIQTTDGGYAVAGTTNSFGAGGYDMLIVKLSSSGTLQWAKTIGGGGDDYAFSIIQATDGGYAVSGWGSFGSGLFSVIKLDSSGALQWARSFPGNYPNSIIQTADGGYAVAGRSPPIPYTFYIVKLDASGTLQWTRTVGLRDADIPHSIIQTADGGYAVAGYTEFVEGYPDMYIVKLSSNGTLQWSRTVGGTDDDRAFSIIRTTDGGYAAAGRGGPAGDMYIVKFDSNWNTCGNSTLVSSQPGTWDSISSVTPTVTSQTGFITPRTPVVGSGGTLTTICVTGIQPISNEIPASFKLYQNYPNPFNSKSKIKFQISKTSNVRLIVSDALGREVESLVNEQLRAGMYEVTLDASNYSSGIYFYKLEADGELKVTKKMIITK
jgi:hypothetical protein